MIIVKIMGGLGNQLFQYAAGRALAARHNTELKLDIAALGADPLRKLELSALQTNFQIALEREIVQYKASTRFQRIRARFTPYSRKRFYKQPYFHFDKRFFLLPANAYLQGYFQSEKYFSDIQAELRLDLRLKTLPSHLADIAAELKNAQSVSLHIRRGDYKNLSIQKVHGLLPLDYYNAAIQRMEKEVPNLRIYLFSDDPQIALKESGATDVTVVSGEITKNSLEDFWLMSQCRHNIIANSSFSWWAAWLNDNADKVVIGPKKWFANGPIDTHDILPDTWIKI